MSRLPPQLLAQSSRLARAVTCVRRAAKEERAAKEGRSAVQTALPHRTIPGRWAAPRTSAHRAGSHSVCELGSPNHHPVQHSAQHLRGVAAPQAGPFPTLQKRRHNGVPCLTPALSCASTLCSHSLVGSTGEGGGGPNTSEWRRMACRGQREVTAFSPASLVRPKASAGPRESHSGAMARAPSYTWSLQGVWKCGCVKRR